MFLRKNWLPISVFLLAIVAVGLYYLQTQQTLKDPIVIYKATPVEVEKPTTEAQKDDASQDGHFHADGTWHEGPHDAHAPAPVDVDPIILPPLSEASQGESIPLRTVLIPDGIDKDWASMPPEELATAIKAIEEHRVEEPEGYSYRRKSDDSLLLDENGYPILHKRGEPFFTLHWVQGFRPTPEQYAEYKALGKQYMEIRAWSVSSPELDGIKAQREEMRQTYVGEVPHVVATFAVPDGTDMEAFYKRTAERSSQLRREAYRKAGLGYMLD